MNWRCEKRGVHLNTRRENWYCVPGILLTRNQFGPDVEGGANTDNGEVFAGPCFSLLSGDKDYKILHYRKFVGWDRLTDSPNSWAQTMMKPLNQTMNNSRKRGMIRER